MDTFTPMPRLLTSIPNLINMYECWIEEYKRKKPTYHNQVTIEKLQDTIIYLKRLELYITYFN